MKELVAGMLAIAVAIIVVVVTTRERAVAPSIKRARALPELRVAIATAPAAERTIAFDEVAALGTAEAVTLLAEVAGSDDRLAARAAVALGSMKSPAQALADLASSSRPILVRANAVRAYAATGRDTSVLLELARGDQPLRVRQEALLALGRIGTVRDSGAIGELLRDPQEPVRVAALQALRSIGGPEAKRLLAAHSRRELSSVERAFASAAP